VVEGHHEFRQANAKRLERIYAMQSRTSRLFAAMRAIPQPIVAAVHGAASPLPWHPMYV